MRLYANLINTKLALRDQPITKYDSANKNIFQKVIAQLLVCDSLPDDNVSEVASEALRSLQMQDPSFEILFNNEFEEFVENKSHLSRWQKIKQDYGYFISKEIKRRNKENPYYLTDINKFDNWDSLPDYSRQKINRPWQYDHLNRDAQILAGQVHELTRGYKEQGDKDLLRAKVNSILVPEKIIFALNSAEFVHGFSEIETTIANMKISLDAYKLAHTFLNRTIESLHKMGWNQQGEAKSTITKTINFGEELLEKLNQRIQENEKRLMVYLAFAQEGEE